MYLFALLSDVTPFNNTQAHLLCVRARACTHTRTHTHARTPGAHFTVKINGPLFLNIALRPMVYLQAKNNTITKEHEILHNKECKECSFVILCINKAWTVNCKSKNLLS